MIQARNSRVYRHNRSHLKPICYDGTFFQDHSVKKEKKWPKLNSFQDHQPTKVKSVSFQEDSSYMDARSMLSDGPDLPQTPPPSPSASPQKHYSPRSLSYSPPASLPSREPSMHPSSEDSSPKGRRRHRSEPTFIRPLDVDRTHTWTFSTIGGNFTS